VTLITYRRYYGSNKSEQNLQNWTQQLAAGQIN
jgi:hypothetical protein